MAQRSAPGFEYRDRERSREDSESHGRREQQLAIVRDRLARGFYDTEWAARQIAIRLLDSGDVGHRE